MEGARAAGAQTEYFDLYDYLFKGCVSCYQCQRADSKLRGKCAFQDAASPILDRLNKADAIILGSPVFLHGFSGMLHSLLERFLYANMYRAEYSAKIVPSLFIITMGATKERFLEQHYTDGWENLLDSIGNTFNSPCETLYSFNCSQHKNPLDYRVPYAGNLSKEKVIAFKEKYKEENFPLDCQRAFEIGRRLGKEEVC